MLHRWRLVHKIGPFTMADIGRGRDVTTGRRQFLAALAVVPWGLAGCQFTKSAPTPATKADNDAFPVSVQHAFGETVIESDPRRIATLGPVSNDTCLALGVVPLAMPLSEAQPNGSTPWFDSVWKKFGVDLPLLLDVSKGLPVDELRGMGPDLILAVNSQITRAQYDELSTIAPVVVSPDASSIADWRSSLALIGKALGRQDESERVRLETEARITSDLNSYPDLAGTTFVVVKARSAIGADLEVMGAESSAVRMIEEWGLRLSPSVSLVGQEGRALGVSQMASTSYSWPESRGADLFSDIAVISVMHKESGQIEAAGVLGTIPAHMRDTYLMADSKDGALALDTGSCLSSQWLSRTMLPELAKSAFKAKQGV